MTKLIWFLAFVACVAANDIQGVLPLPEEAKKFLAIDEPKPESLPMVKLTKAESIKEELENSKDFDETFLKPISPIFPSFLQPGNFFDRMRGLQKNGLADSSKPKSGILTIILVKSKNHNNQDMIEDPNKASKTVVESAENTLEKTEEKFKTLTQFLLNDLFGHKMMFGPEQSKSANLLGGGNDPDQFIKFNGGDGFASNDFIHYVKGDEMPIMSDDIGRHREFFGDNIEEEKKCSFLKFLRLKAHVHYRSIIHLIFISGIILIVMMFLSLTIQVNKRRRALRRFANKQNIDIMSVDSAAAKQREAEGLAPRSVRTFRLGSLLSTSEQRMAPPSYDQINNQTKQQSSLTKSLASAYKNRYAPMSSDDEDRKSVSSLPPYEEKK